MSSEIIMDGKNRCRRCNRPLSNPTDSYGWRCAQIVGLGNYQRAVEVLDEEELMVYNAYAEKYLESKSVKEDISRTNEATIVSTIKKEPVLLAVNWKEASDIIVRNADAIKNAGAYYKVNPAIIAACIYTEQTTNVNIVDEWTDVPFCWADTSIGIGQVKVSTAKMLEDAGYIAKTEYKETEVYGGIITAKWSTPGFGNGEVYADSREEAIAYRLTSETENVNYVAAYLAYWQDRWKGAYPEIDGRTAVLATLFNQGERRPSHANPTPNDFGTQAKKRVLLYATIIRIR